MKAHGNISLRVQAGSRRLPASYGTPGSYDFKTVAHLHKTPATIQYGETDFF